MFTTAIIPHSWLDTYESELEHIYTHTQQDKWGVGCILFGAYKSCTEVKQKRNRILIETQIDKRCHFNIIILVIIM